MPPEEVDFIGGFEDEEIDLKQYWHLLRKYMWIILGMASLVATLAGLIRFLNASSLPIHRNLDGGRAGGQGFVLGGNLPGRMFIRTNTSKPKWRF